VEKKMEKFLKIILKFEGGFVNHPADRGGVTNKGITQEVYDMYRKRMGHPIQTVRYIEDREVAEIYRKSYWERAGCHLVNDERLQLLLFDFAVNSGVSRASKELQKLVGVVVDGDIGAKTAAAVNAENQNRLVARYLMVRIEFFYSIVGKNPSQNVFLNGWLNRVERLIEEIL
jgi:lysozyme family protein